MRLPVTSQDYLSKLVEYGIMKLPAAANVKETNQSWIEEDDFQVIMPTIDIKVIIVKSIRSHLMLVTYNTSKRRLPRRPKWDSR